MKSKFGVVFLGMVVACFQCLTSWGTPINLIQNGTFQSGFTGWNGIIGLVGSPPAPNGIYAAGAGIYQDVSTTQGQMYDLSFYAAADLYFGPSAQIAVKANGTTIGMITTPSITYNNQINRSEQMVWQFYSYSFIASSPLTRLQFIDLNTFDFGLAGVSMQVPENANTGAMLATGGLFLLAVARTARLKIA